MDGILGKKLGMIQIFDEEGNAVPVTVIEAGPCAVIQVKREETDGYNAVQLGFGKKKKVNKPLAGHFRQAGVNPKAFLREIRTGDVDSLQPGMEVRVEEVFEVGDRVDVIGITKGKGFTGVVKRYGFGGGSTKSHGGSTYHRAPGSIGAAAFPARVFKGKRLPGRMGGKRYTVANLEVVKIIPEDNKLLVRGAVPGAKNGYLIIRKSKKA